jgi:hypothetical protein
MFTLLQTFNLDQYLSKRLDPSQVEHFQTVDLLPSSQMLDLASSIYMHIERVSMHCHGIACTRSFENLMSPLSGKVMLLFYLNEAIFMCILTSLWQVAEK